MAPLLHRLLGTKEHVRALRMRQTSHIREKRILAISYYFLLFTEDIIRSGKYLTSFKSVNYGKKTIYIKPINNFNTT
jgi:hypothetical protein